ncbi:MAG: hypothetical protein HUU14_09445, partial [Dehalococcoidia bacterium]|nr:hypothetical protein [Dehalococcoidia bacterium]
AFMRELYERCRTANTVLGAWLNGSCEVIAIGQEDLELGFYHPLHMQKVDKDCRTLVEQQAELMLGRAVRLKVRQVERGSPASRRAPKGGHLVEAARALGATPVAKDGD